MKRTTKLKIIAGVLLTVAAILIILGAGPLRDKSWDDFAWKPNFGLFIPGVFLAFITIPLWISSFAPLMTKWGAEIHAETMDKAGSSLQTAGKKTVDVAAPVVSYGFDKMQPTVQKGINMVSEAFRGHGKTKDRAALLTEAKKLYEDKLITEEEYKKMRRDILDIEE
jgi:hypothetical protein